MPGPCPCLRLLSVVVATSVLPVATSVLPAIAMAQARQPVREFRHGGDAFLHVVFESRSPETVTRSGGDGERLTTTVRHRWSVDGVLEVETTVPAPGKRAYGEGGLQERKESWRESSDSGVHIGVLEATFPRSAAPLQKVRIVLDTKQSADWREIDAVALLGADR